MDDNIIQLDLDGPRHGRIDAKTVMNETGIEYAHHYCNPFRRCSFLCRYPCYAKKITQQFGKIPSDEEGGNAAWRTPLYIDNYMELIEKYIPKIDTGERVFLSTMTDIYGADVLNEGVAREIITTFNEAGVEFILLTKSTKFLSDLDVFADSKVGKLGVSITTNMDNHKMTKYYEVGTPSIEERLKALKEASDYGGIDLWVSAEPFLPQTDFQAYFREIFEYTDGNLSELMVGKANYSGGLDDEFNWGSVVPIIQDYDDRYPGVQFHYKKQFVKYLEKHFPDLTPSSGYPNVEYHKRWRE